MDNTKDTPETAPETAPEKVTSNEADVVKANDAESSQSSEQNEASEAKKLGELLLSYREKVGMDLDQAADAMCLTRGTLEALENEDFHLLPEAPYIRGYLRGYAKLASVSSAEAVALYESIRGGDPLMQTPYHFTPSAKDDNLATQGWSSSLWKVMGAVLLFVLLLGLWTIPEVKSWVNDTWAEFSQKNSSKTSSELADTQENGDDEGKENAASDEKASADASNNTEKLPESELIGKIRRDGDVPDLAQNDKVSPDNPDENKSDDKSADTEGNSGDDEQSANKESENAEDNASNSSNTSTDNAASDSNTSDDNAANNAEGDQAEESQQDDKKENNGENTKNAENADGNSEENSSETDGDTIAVDLSDVDTEAGEVAIKLVFEDEVWMRIKKKGGKQVFAGLRKKGEVHEMKAVKPLKFKVGNAPGVKIYINGKLFDQDPYQRGVVSRFEVE